MKKISLILLLTLSTALAHAVETPAPDRLNEVAERGSKVMPFNLDKTLHIFTKTEQGGLQQVLAKDAKDVEQIALIRKHLSEIALHFSQGDFSGPRRIHGDNMPGVKILSQNAEQIHFVYRELERGGEIEYRTKVPKLIDAIHVYFDAQLSDHARHAMPGGHAQHHSQQP
ncbi:aspartate carbamoyltransferase [Methyloprofundus sedimenti]|uniref:Aspartate carbamoyltransferase n=1 Tax=Methyloprofundus sedimenti TaxID=1420851 RepID=A0A1V8MAJ9_9GAMM|nr:aspartate carbamoyltransferase [Methyloprofundus sedimenti]OQK18557.1 aspartate carbamoyltransferase [Methyloprofundus sedimenti]